ncbi:MAG: thioredoxin-disulfide reductase [Desulfurispora sp.]|uniref:thioredoxin-disulfide reductase n=1 Tax=Desulfurispora sp. TaxID=3014275 RepID=UPI00404A4D2C
MKLYDVIIIGGGPAGLSAGIYAARANLDAVLIEMGMTGGLAASTEMIENYPGFENGIGGPELAMQMEKQARRFGLEMMYAYVSGVDKQGDDFIVSADEQNYRARAVIFAAGAKPRYLGVPGEKEFHGRGVSYCATCDGAFFREKVVAVVGGGDAAVEEALFLTKFARQVYVIHRREQLRATRYVQNKARENSKIQFVLSSVVKQVNGNELVRSVTVEDVLTGQQRELPVDGVFIYVGHEPSTGMIAHLVERDEQGYVVTDEQMRTSCPGLYAAGDVRHKTLRQVVTAVADGAIAAVEVEKYLSRREQ